MFRSIASATRPSLFQGTCNPAIVRRSFLSHRQHNSDATEEEIAAARKWVDEFHPEAIPKNIGEISFSRSSGPGGQNVNKVNSKATLRVGLDALLSMVPRPLHSEIRSSRYYAANSNSIIIQADDSRKQKDNEQSCYARLHTMIAEAASKALSGETSAAQAERVKKLQKVENEARLRMKKVHSAKKSARKGGPADY